jgi:hypothetical protein
MKLRLGFVSNSSSASFTVQWKCSSLEDDESIDTALAILLEVIGEKHGYCKSLKKIYVTEEQLDAYKKKYEYDDPLLACLFEVKKRTTEIRHGLFETHFFTTMFNYMGDFGRSAELFMFALMMNKAEHGERSFEIIHMKMERNG